MDDVTRKALVDALTRAKKKADRLTKPGALDKKIESATKRARKAHNEALSEVADEIKALRSKLDAPDTD